MMARPNQTPVYCWDERGARKGENVFKTRLRLKFDLKKNSVFFLREHLKICNVCRVCHN